MKIDLIKNVELDEIEKGFVYFSTPNRFPSRINLESWIWIYENHKMYGTLNVDGLNKFPFVIPVKRNKKLWLYINYDRQH